MQFNTGVLSSLVFVGLSYVFLRLVRLLVRPRAALRYIPGPPCPSFVYGNLKQIWNSEHPDFQEAWLAQYGPTVKYHAFFNTSRVMTADLKALSHIFAKSTVYQRIPQQRWMLARILGEGVLVAEGEAHRKQRRVLNPAFGIAQIRDLMSTFMEQSQKLCEFWSVQFPVPNDSARINVLDGLSKTTFNIIGLAGFGYDFDALTPSSKNELSEAFNVIFSSADGGIPFWPIAQAFIPPLRLIQTQGTRRLKEAQGVMRRIGMQLIAEKKAAVLRSLTSGGTDRVEKKDLHGRDLLTLLIKANMATDLPEDLRLSDDDVLSQVPTFLVAGHETTSAAATWCLFALTQAPEVQKKLRDELLTVPTDTPTLDELDALPYLDKVVRETLRLHAPVPSSAKHATKDDIIPLSKPYRDTRGQLHHTLKVEKGTNFAIPIMVVNRSKELWGEDASEFKPERWDSLPEAVANIPGVWSNMLTFIGGPRACIGYRFTIAEMKALIFTLVRVFEFELDVPVEDIKKRHKMTQRPVVQSEMEKGNQMPLLVKRYQRL
ncbi:cytochrome P450 [Obba rivulosa]|uniref:Cytochrome P450 n=1 Tax=Obba rivulosa TaxID=1052685 RepID=A0A8E2AHF7_9APHY|nr:cytochrome P450 [Obba rivulosa]